MYCRNCGTPDYDTPEHDSRPFWEPDLCLACHHKPATGYHYNYLSGTLLPRQTITTYLSTGTQQEEQPMQLLTFKEAMAYLKVSRSTLNRLLRNKDLEGHKIGATGAQWRFTKEQLKGCLK